MRLTFAAIAGTTALALLGNAQAEDALDVKIRNGWKVAAFQDGVIAQRSNKTLYPTVTTTNAAQTWNYVISHNVQPPSGSARAGVQ